MNSRIRSIGPVLAALALSLGACGGDDSGGDGETGFPDGWFDDAGTDTAADGSGVGDSGEDARPDTPADTVSDGAADAADLADGADTAGDTAADAEVALDVADAGDASGDADAAGDADTGTAGVTNPWVAFLRVDTSFDVPYIVPADGSAAAVALDEDGLWSYASPTFSADGETVFYLFQSETLALRSLGLSSGERASYAVADGLVSVGGLSLSPDGAQAAYRGISAGPISDIIVTTLDSGVSRNLTSNEAPAFAASPVWSPDGDALFYVGGASESGDVYSMPVATGSSDRTQLTTVGDVAGSISVSADGERVIFNRLGAGPHVLTVDSGDVAPLAGASTADAGCVEWGDGVRVVCSRGTGTRNIVVVDTGTGSVVKDLGTGTSPAVGSVESADVVLGF